MKCLLRGLVLTSAPGLLEVLLSVVDRFGWIEVEGVVIDLFGSGRGVCFDTEDSLFLGSYF